MNRIVIASANPGKLRELTALLKPLGIEAAPQSAFAVEEVEEPHFTFLENALAKARHAANMTGMPALADDSGLCVRRYSASPGCTRPTTRGAKQPEERDARNNAKLVEAMRAAATRSAILLRPGTRAQRRGPAPIMADGMAWRDILEPRGANGFGYDPYFAPPMDARRRSCREEKIAEPPGAGARGVGSEASDWRTSR